MGNKLKKHRMVREKNYKNVYLVCNSQIKANKIPRVLLFVSLCVRRTLRCLFHLIVKVLLIGGRYQFFLFTV